MSYTYKITSEPNDDRPGVQVWIERSDGEVASLACCQNEEDPFDDGTPLPAAVLRRAEAYADTVDY